MTAAQAYAGITELLITDALPHAVGITGELLELGAVTKPGHGAPYDFSVELEGKRYPVCLQQHQATHYLASGTLTTRQSPFKVQQWAVEHDAIVLLVQIGVGAYVSSGGEIKKIVQQSGGTAQYINTTLLRRTSQPNAHDLAADIVSTIKAGEVKALDPHDTSFDSILNMDKPANMPDGLWAAAQAAEALRLQLDLLLTPLGVASQRITSEWLPSGVVLRVLPGLVVQDSPLSAALGVRSKASKGSNQYDSDALYNWLTSAVQLVADLVPRMDAAKPSGAAAVLQQQDLGDLLSSLQWLAGQELRSDQDSMGTDDSLVEPATGAGAGTMAAGASTMAAAAAPLASESPTPGTLAGATPAASSGQKAGGNGQDEGGPSAAAAEQSASLAADARASLLQTVTCCGTSRELTRCWTRSWLPWPRRLALRNAPLPANWLQTGQRTSTAGCWRLQSTGRASHQTTLTLQAWLQQFSKTSAKPRHVKCAHDSWPQAKCSWST